MASPRSIQQNFTAGEFSPQLFGRTDTEKYFSGAAIIENMVCQTQGGVSKRPGTEYIESTKGNGVARLIRFEFNIEQAYIIEIGFSGGAGYARFYRNRAQILNVGVPYEIVTPWAAADIDSLQIAASTDTLYIVHPSYKPRSLTRTGHTAWVLSNYAPTGDPFTSANNYPAAATFFQQRLIMGGTNSNPSKIWASRSGDFNNMVLGTADSDGYSYTITSGSGHVPVIRWLAGANDLIIGTASAEVRATGGNFNPITPTNIDVREQTNKGSAKHQPVILSRSAIFNQRSQKKLMNLAYSLASDGYEAGNISIISSHMMRGVINHLAYKAEPEPTLYTYRNDGQLLGLTYEKDQEVIAWHRHIIGTGGAVESVASIPYSGGNELWAIVRYSIGGSTVRHVVVFNTEEWRDLAAETSAEIKTAMRDCFYVDSGLSYDGPPATIISGLNHLIGETVAILADGIVVPRQVVNGSGQITLITPASKVHVGLPYRCRLKTLPLGSGVGANGAGAPFGHKIGWIEPKILLYLSSECTIRGEQTVFRLANEVMDDPSPLFSGFAGVDASGYDEQGQIEVEQDVPLPLTILAIGGEVDIVQ